LNESFFYYNVEVTNTAKYKGYDISLAKGMDGFAGSDMVSSWAKTAMEWAVPLKRF
jgi:hypothetical protein